MKRIIALALTVLLLTACGTQESVPAYSDPPSQATENTHVPSEESTEPPSQSAEPSYVARDEEALRLSYTASANPEGFYYLDGSLKRYDLELEKAQTCCPKENCPHADGSCPVFHDVNTTRFGVQDGVAYFTTGAAEETYGYLTSLEFSTVDLRTGETSSYVVVPYMEEQGRRHVDLYDVLVCENTALLSYCQFTLAENGEYPEKKDYSLVEIDLNTGKMTFVLNREIASDEWYDLWAMNESHVVLAYHYDVGFASAYGGRDNWGSNMDYDDFVRNGHRWVLLEYPLEENARWSKQVAVSDGYHELRLYHYGSFYDGRLYYLSDGDVRVYDLKTHRSEALFPATDVTDLFCLDEQVFYTTSDGSVYRYSLRNGTLVEGKEAEFSLIAERGDHFYGRYENTLTFTYCCISKEDYYAGNFGAATLIPLW